MEGFGEVSAGRDSGPWRRWAGVIHRIRSTCQDLNRRSRPSVRAEDDITGGNGRLLDELTTIVSAAAAAILAVRAGSLETRTKSDLTPVTAADEAALARLPIAARHACGSAVKFCQLAEGSADIYPRLATTCEWDVAAGHAVLAAAGGVITTPEGAPLSYGRMAENFRIPAFIAWGDPSAAAGFGG